MRTRLVLASAALGAALLTGGAVATAQAAPASLDPGNTAAAAPPTTSAIVVAGWYSSYAACEGDGENSVYSYWYCKWSSSRSAWGLYVDTNS
ncbi:hypothetical protein ACFV2X_16660 [Streptomyces sp. NPDC059679]|uniref:hypothetical protein n=1 Tax=Streptomyces sp. NPDC059679 TaxID=3346903 RepID=UPI0036B482CC